MRGVDVRDHDPVGSRVEDALHDAGLERGDAHDGRDTRQQADPDEVVRRLEVDGRVLEVDHREVESGERDELHAGDRGQLHPRAECRSVALQRRAEQTAPRHRAG
jgi:hypothetical protein